MNSEKKTVRSLFFMTHNLLGGGCEHVICRLANRYAKDGIAVTICTECNDAVAYPLDSRVRVYPLSGERIPSSRDLPGIYRALRRLVRRKKPDAVLAMPEKVNVWTLLALIGSKTPVFVSERNDPRLHPISRLKRFLRPIVYPTAAGYIFQTKEAAAFFSKAVQKRGIVLPNPLDPDELPPVYTGERTREIVAAGRLDAQKNFSVLLAAFALFHSEFPDYRLVIYGEGEERASLEEKISALALTDCVSLPGRKPALPTLIRESAMFVLSSDHEGMPNVLLEAMSCGLPVISTDCPVGGPRELIRDGENGLLVPVGDAPAIAAAMKRLAGDPAFSARLGASAAELRSAFSTDLVAKEWRDYLEKHLY